MNNLNKALELFIHGMRNLITEELGEDWERKYVMSLLTQQQEFWGKQRAEYDDPKHLIDFGNLKSFALNNKDFFWKYFDVKAHNLPSNFDEIAEARNMVAHYSPFDRDKADLAFHHMIRITQKSGLTTLSGTIRSLKEDKTLITSNSPAKPTPAKRNAIQGKKVVKNFSLSKSKYGQNLTLCFTDIHGNEVEYDHDAVLDQLGERITELPCWHKYGTYTNSKKLPKFVEGLETVKIHYYS